MRGPTPASAASGREGSIGCHSRQPCPDSRSGGEGFPAGAGLAGGRSAHQDRQRALPGEGALGGRGKRLVVLTWHIRRQWGQAGVAVEADRVVDLQHEWVSESCQGLARRPQAGSRLGARIRQDGQAIKGDTKESPPDIAVRKGIDHGDRHEGEIRGALTGRMFGHHPDNPVTGQQRGTGHARPGRVGQRYSGRWQRLLAGSRGSFGE